MHKILIIITLFGAFGVFGQGFEKTFTKDGFRMLNGVDSVSPDILRLIIQSDQSGGQNSFSSEIHALYYPKQDSLGTSKVVISSSYNFRTVVLAKISETQQIRLVFYDTYALISSYWID
jgi:hypothetical protein